MWIGFNICLSGHAQHSQAIPLAGAVPLGGQGGGDRTGWPPAYVHRPSVLGMAKDYW